MERHTFEVAALTWNVNEARPDPQTGLHRWVIDLSKEASLFVVALQEIESGGGSLALAAAKDALLTKQQASVQRSVLKACTDWRAAWLAPHCGLWITCKSVRLQVPLME